MTKQNLKYSHHQSMVIIKPRINKNFVLVVFLLTVFAIFQLVLRSNINKTLNSMEQVRTLNHQLDQEIGLLRIDSTKFTSSDLIRKIAEEKLNMIDASSSPIVLKYGYAPVKREKTGKELTIQSKPFRNKEKLKTPTRESDVGGIE